MRAILTMAAMAATMLAFVALFTYVDQPCHYAFVTVAEKGACHRGGCWFKAEDGVWYDAGRKGVVLGERVMVCRKKKQ